MMKIGAFLEGEFCIFVYFGPISYFVLHLFSVPAHFFFNRFIFHSIIKKWNSIERTADKLDRENEIRRELRRWDREHPEAPVEMIVRTVVPGLISVVATQVYLAFCKRVRDQRRY